MGGSQCLALPCLQAGCGRPAGTLAPLPWPTTCHPAAAACATAHQLLTCRRLPPIACAGSCPISPLALPRRLANGTLASAVVTSIMPASALASTVSAVAATVGAPYPAGAALPAAAGSTRQQSPMRRRIVNLTAAADEARPGAAAPTGGELSAAGSQQQRKGSQSGQVWSVMQALTASNPALPVGLHSSLRSSVPAGSAPTSSSSGGST